MDHIQTVGIIGLGSFGRFLTQLIPDAITVKASSRTVTQLDGVQIVPLEEAVRVDVLILGFPLGAYEPMLTKIAPLLAPETLVVDVCSVKVKPEETLRRLLLGRHNILATHPLFGPQSAAKSTAGHRLIVTSHNNNDAKTREFLAFCEMQLQLDISYMSAAEHDKIMARVHALTFFVARGLADMELGDEIFMTPSYQHLLDMVAFDRSHSQELFETIESGNPFALEMRQKFMRTLEAIDEKI